jgi:hypothetical protein
VAGVGSIAEHWIYSTGNLRSMATIAVATALLGCSVTRYAGKNYVHTS